MLETAAPQEMKIHYDRAHTLRAQAFVVMWRAMIDLLRAKEKGPRVAALPLAC